MPVPEGTKLAMTPEVRLKIEQAAAMDCTMEEIAFFAGLSKQTLYNWMSSDPEFKERLDALRNEPILKARATITGALGKEDTAKWYLERKAKKEFAQRAELTGKDGEDLLKPTLTEEERTALKTLFNAKID